MKEYLSSVEDVLEAQGAHPKDGLDAQVADERLKTVGLNKLDEEEKEPLWKRFFAQMADPMIIMLLVAAVISAITGAVSGEADIADVVIILTVVIINAVLGVVQESKAEAALEALQEMSAAQSKVMRGGKLVMLPSSELVPGDVIMLEAGDSVPADCRVLESASMKIEEAALTGESLPVVKHANALELAEGIEDIPLGDRKNMAYMGSTVVFGRGSAVVVATGMKTEMGKIANALTTAKKEQTPLQIKLAQLSRILTVMVLVICAVIFGVDFLRHGAEMMQDPSMILNTFMVAVSLAVAAIPEGLVAVVTIVLSMGVTKMSNRQAIIRKLTAVETLGCTQIICSDKTGTLTQNKMTVVEHHVASSEEKFLSGMALCCDARWDAEAGEAIGEPTECALVNDAAKNNLLKGDLEQATPRVGEAPFDSGRKMMSVVVRMADGSFEQYTKGAPDEILKRCTHIMKGETVCELTDADREQIAAQNKAMADNALRVLACSMRMYNELPTDMSAEALENELVFLGLSGMIDPVRPEVKQAINEARAAGIRPVMITGDHIDTAVAIARDLGIIEDKSQALTGLELDKISDEDFKAQVANYSVYARVQPEHKSRIVEAWKSQGKVVAMTGDGVNDAPSIKRADIGIGMGITGTDVTKNVADMVLADDNFATIIHAVEEGRRIYDNIRKAIQFLLSSNLAEVLAVFVASLLGFTILQPVHLLWINLITDCFPALALGMEIAENDIMKRKPRESTDGIFAGGLGIDCVFQGIIIGILTLVSYMIGFHFDTGSISIAALATTSAEGITMAFLTLSMVEMFHSFNMRSRRGSVFSMKHQNKWLWASFALSLLLTFVVIETPLAVAFDFVQLSASHYAIAFLLAFSIIPIMEVYKAIMRSVEKDA